MATKWTARYYNLFHTQAHSAPNLTLPVLHPFQHGWIVNRMTILFVCLFVQDGSEQDALAHITYDCKLVYRLENEFSPYTRCDAKDVMMKLVTFVVDPRFSGESLFLKLYGDALGPLAETVKTAYTYIVKAADIKPKKV